MDSQIVKLDIYLPGIDFSSIPRIEKLLDLTLKSTELYVKTNWFMYSFYRINHSLNTSLGK